MRGYEIARALNRIGHEARFMRPPGLPGPLRSEMIGSMVRYTAGSRHDRYDAIMVVKPYPSGSIPALLLSGGETAFILDIDDLDAAYRKGWRSAAIGAIQKPFPRSADLITCHNRELARYLSAKEGVPPDMIYRLEQGVDIPLFDPDRKIVTGIGDGKLIVNVCHFDAAADLEPLLDSLAIVVSRDPSIEVKIVGGGPLLPRYRSRIRGRGLSGNVHLTGPLAQEEVAAAVAEADLCTVFYSDNYANRYRSSLKIREYLAMGKKVVSTDVGELRRFAPYTYQTEADPVSFAGMVLSAIDVRRSKRAERGQRLVRSNLSWTRIATRFARRLEEML